MDVGDKIVALSNAIYIDIAHKLRAESIPPSLGRIVVESVYRRFADDALAVSVSRNVSLESELVKKTKEVDELKGASCASTGIDEGGE